jgi:hypothetical protein
MRLMRPNAIHLSAGPGMHIVRSVSIVSGLLVFALSVASRLPGPVRHLGRQLPMFPSFTCPPKHVTSGTKRDLATVPHSLNSSDVHFLEEDTTSDQPRTHGGVRTYARRVNKGIHNYYSSTDDQDQEKDFLGGQSSSLSARSII